MAALLSSSVRGRVALGSNTGHSVVRLGDQIDGDSMDALQGPRCAMVSGYSVHANVFIQARDRDRLERLIRYAARPAVSTERLSELADGRLLYRLKRPWRDGTAAVIFERQDFMAKLAVLVPAPRAHLTRYHGLLAPAAACRPMIVLTAHGNSDNTALDLQPEPQPTTEPVDGESATPAPSGVRARNYTWAELMKRVFNQPTNCITCSRNVRPCPDHPSVPSALWPGD
jgi:hypothetical protein